MTSAATLHLLCGKICAGKSTLAATLAAQPQSILLAQDHWLSHLYPGEIVTLADYDRREAQLREAIAGHIEVLLKVGMNVVLDFPANTPETRAWMRGLIDRTGAAHILHYLDVSDDICRGRLHARNAAGHHAYTVSDAEFDEFTSYFVAPSEAEAFNVVKTEQ